MNKANKVSDMIAVNVDPCPKGRGRGLHVLQHDRELSIIFHNVVEQMLRDKGCELPTDKRVEVRFTGVIKAEEIADAVKASVQG